MRHVSGVKDGEGAPGVTGCVVTAVRAEIDVAERHHRRCRITGPVVFEVLHEFIGARWVQRCDVLGEERQLLCEPTADDRVVLIEAQTLGLAHHDLLADMVVDEGIEFGRRRGATHLRLPQRCQAVDLRLRHDDHTVVGIAAQPSVRTENGGTDE